MVSAIQNYILGVMGQQYIEPPTFDLSLSYKDSNFSSPLIFVLSPGADPMAGLFRFAEEQGESIRINNHLVITCSHKSLRNTSFSRFLFGPMVYKILALLEGLIRLLYGFLEKIILKIVALVEMLIYALHSNVNIVK